MLLFTWSGLMYGIQDVFEWFFKLMELPNRNLNIVFIVIGFLGISYWLYTQYQYNVKAEQEGSIK